MKFERTLESPFISQDFKKVNTVSNTYACTYVY